MTDQNYQDLLHEIKLLRAAVEQLAPPKPIDNDVGQAQCFLWSPKQAFLQPVPAPNRVAFALIKGVDHVKTILFDNTKRFAGGLAANNTLLWGARGMGKSSLVKAVHAELCHTAYGDLKLVEIHREDIHTLPMLLNIVRDLPQQFILFCDDLSFDHDDTAYKSLKAALDGGIEGRPKNVIFYATSNRRHLLPRDMMDNERSSAINPHEAVEEKVSLSDRFGLWLGFHKCNQDDYLSMVYGYADHYHFELTQDELKAQALEWATTRGSRSGRVAFQFITDLAGRLGVAI